MTYFKELTNLPILDLSSEFDKLMNQGIIDWYRDSRDQICLNSIKGHEDDIHLGRGSLVYDWDNYTRDENGALVVPERKIRLLEKDFNVLCTQFKGTAFEEAYNTLSEQYTLGRVRIMNLKPKTCLSWHVDDSIRIHYPIKTQKGCMMIIKNTVFEMEKGKWYETNTLHEHTALNASKEERYHLVASIVN
jgi:hypothetical protein